MKLNCSRCEKEFETDLDLDKKVKDLLNFPAVFWNLCDDCKRKEFSYTRDEAVAFRLIEGTCTEHEVLSLGCTREHLKLFRQAGIKAWNIDYRKSSRRLRKRRH